MESKLRSPKISPVQFVDVFGESVTAVDVWDDHDTFDGIAIPFRAGTLSSSSSNTATRRNASKSRKSRKSLSPTRKPKSRSGRRIRLQHSEAGAEETF